MASKYYCQMFSGVWQENTNRVMIDAYSYDVYYSYLQTNDITIIEVGVTNKRISQRLR